MELEYFRIAQSKQVANPIQIDKLDRKKYIYKMTPETFDKLDDLVVAYYTPDRGLEFCDILVSPCFMVAEKLKDLWQLLQPELRFKGIQLFPSSFEPSKEIKDPMPLYWIPSILPTECLHDAARIYDTGIVEELVLKESAMQGKNILKVAGLVEEYWIVSLTAAESVLRRGALAVGLERVKVRE